MHSFLCLSRLDNAQFANCIIYLIHSQYCRTHRTFILSSNAVLQVWLHQHYLFISVTWPPDFSLISLLIIYCILCLNITCIHSLHNKLCGHITLNRLINNQVNFSLSSQPLTQLTQRRRLNAQSRYHLPWFH